MSISVNTPYIEDTLKQGENSIEASYHGSVDTASENDVKITVTIPDNTPLTFDKNGGKVFTYNQSFPSPKNGERKKTMTIYCSKATADGASCDLKFQFKTKSGRGTTRNVNITY